MDNEQYRSMLNAIILNCGEPSFSNKSQNSIRFQTSRRGGQSGLQGELVVNSVQGKKLQNEYPFPMFQQRVGGGDRVMDEWWDEANGKDDCLNQCASNV